MLIPDVRPKHQAIAWQKFNVPTKTASPVSNQSQKPNRKAYNKLQPTATQVMEEINEEKYPKPHKKIQS